VAGRFIENNWIWRRGGNLPFGTSCREQDASGGVTDSTPFQPFLPKLGSA